MRTQYNIIFLDIDGVLNGYNKWNFLGWRIVSKIKYKPLKLWYKRITEPFSIHESKVKRLAKIVEATDAKIVMSSSWRRYWWKRPYDKQNKDQRRLTELFNKYNIEVIDITPALKSGCRGDEIAQWLHKNKDIVNSYIILDDEVSDMGPFTRSSRFIKTSNIDLKKNVIIYSGLKRKHVKMAIHMLRYKILKMLY